MRGTTVVAVCLLILTGCEPIVAGSMAAASLPATKKLVTDHAASAITGRDCSIVHFEKDGDYCPPYPKDIDRSNLICTKTLGGVDCHERNDRYATHDRPLASPPPKPLP